MDAYAGYNQVMIDVTDEEHTMFTTDKGVYYYKRMLFGLKNAGATYQRLMNKMFVKKLGVTMEVYVDDMLVKRLTVVNHVADLQTVFDIVLVGMRLNPEKCLFGVVKGKFLGHVISRQGIEANPKKVQAILDMEVPKLRSEVQSLTGKIAALARNDDVVELPMYYVGKGFTLAESRYPDIEKLALLPSSFHHPVAIKGQAAADFISKLTPMKNDEELPKNDQSEVTKAPPRGRTELEALAQEIGIKRVQVFSDSQLVVNQGGGIFEAKEPQLSSYQALAKAFLHKFESATITQVPKKENSNADALARLATRQQNDLGDLCHHHWP
ncbi:PREDICTED: uncharacterized protein LOC101295126 [Fragaria vesca subsp. vesca]